MKTQLYRYILFYISLLQESFKQLLNQIDQKPTSLATTLLACMCVYLSLNDCCEKLFACCLVVTVLWFLQYFHFLHRDHDNRNVRPKIGACVVEIDSTNPTAGPDRVPMIADCSLICHNMFRQYAISLIKPIYLSLTICARVSSNTCFEIDSRSICVQTKQYIYYIPYIHIYPEYRLSKSLLSFWLLTMAATDVGIYLMHRTFDKHYRRRFYGLTWTQSYTYSLLPRCKSSEYKQMIDYDKICYLWRFALEKGCLIFFFSSVYVHIAWWSITKANGSCDELSKMFGT